MQDPTGRTIADGRGLSSRRVEEGCYFSQRGEKLEVFGCLRNLERNSSLDHSWQGHMGTTTEAGVGCRRVGAGRSILLRTGA